MSNLSKNSHAAAPAQAAVKYKDVVFAPGIKNFSTPYQGWPNEGNNRLWEELYNSKMLSFSDVVV